MKTSELINKLKETLTPEEYADFKNSVNSLKILPEGLKHEELYSDVGGNLQYFILEVTRRNKDVFAILQRGAFCYTKNPDPESKDNFTYEYIPSSRKEDFIADTRFSLEEAVRIAEEEVEKLKLMGYTLEEIREKFNS